MNFKVIENNYLDFESIADEFSDEYLFGNLSNNELRLKYGMTHGEFRNCSNIVKEKHNISRRPFWKNRKSVPKYYYKKDGGYMIRKNIDGADVYIGFVPSEWVAKTIVELCIAASWDIEICKSFCKDWRDTIERIHS